MTGDQIKQWREQRGISRMELSRLTGVSYHSIQRWELGKGLPSAMALIQLRQIIKEENNEKE
jgi:DNA-binding transcriptional regulator YiaG